MTEDREEVEQGQQELLEASERRMRALVTGIPQLVFRSDGFGKRSWSSPQWTAFTGLSCEDSAGLGWVEAVHPDDRETTLAGWRGFDKCDYRCEHRIRSAAGSFRRHQTIASPSRNREGQIVEWLGISTDVEEIRSLQEQQQVLLAELQHRVNNMLGIIRSVGRRTAEASDNVEDLWAHLEGRIGALGRAQSWLARGRSAGIALTALVADELLVHVAHEGEQLTISGPDIGLTPKAAETISLTLHELTTNAVKFGALTSPAGRIAVRWNLVRSGQVEWLAFTWEESGVRQMPSEPEHEGFGFDLFDRALPYELGAETKVEFRRDGLNFSMVIPTRGILVADGSE